MKDQIEKIKTSGADGVILQNCRSRMDGDLYELVLSKQSSVASSPKKFKVDDALKKSVGEIKVECIDSLVTNVGNKVGVKGNYIGLCENSACLAFSLSRE